MKEAEGWILRKLNWKLPAQKNEYTCENNISKIYSENLRKLRMNQSQKLFVIRHQTRTVYARRTWLSAKKNFK